MNIFEEIKDITNLKLLKSFYLNLYNIASELKNRKKIEKSKSILLEIIDNCTVDFEIVGKSYFKLYEINGDKENLKKCLEFYPTHNLAKELLKNESLNLENYWELGAKVNPLFVIAEVNSLKEFEETAKYDVNILLKHLNKDYYENILDIGCGIGRMIKNLSNFCENIYGVDISKNMIEKSKEYLKELKNVKTLTVENEKLPFLENSFDLVYSFIVFMHIPYSKVQNYIDESYRILKENGILYFQIFGDFSDEKTLDPFDNIINGSVRAYSKENIKNLTKKFQKVEIFIDKLDRYNGKYWYFVKCIK